MIVFDGHCDTAVEFWRRGRHLDKNDLQLSLESTEKLDGYVQFFAFCTIWMETDDKERSFRSAFENFLQELNRFAPRSALCRTAADAETAVAEGKLGAFVSIEGAEAIACDPGKLDDVWEKGIRMIAPTWNAENALSGSCVTGNGLTAQGREFCRRAQRLGMILDVSHLSDRGFWDLCDLAEKPILASHSNSRACCGHARNLTDEQFKAICQLGGSAGINLYAPFLNESGEATLDDVYRHIDHFMELGGEGHVALGGDLDGCDTLPDGFQKAEDYRKLETYLRARGYGEPVIKDIFYRTLKRIVKQCIM